MSQSNSLVPVCPAFAVRGQLRTQRGLPFAEHLPASLIHSLGHQFGIVFRKRIFTPAVTLWTFLSQVLDHDHSCRQAVARLLAYRMSMPDTAKNAKAFPKSKRFRPGMGFPVMRLVVVFSLAVGTVLEAAFGPAKGKGTGELSLFRQLANQFQRGDVLLGDRLYGSYWNIAQALAKGVDVVVRLYGCRIPISFVGQRDDNRRVCWQKPIRPPWMSLRDYQRLPCQLVLRAVRVRVSQVGFRTRQLVLITTLTDAAAVSGASLADLYRRRWQAELHLRSLKQTLQMDILRGRSPAMVRKEVWAHLLVYNLVRVVMAQAAVADALRPDEISFTGALQTINGFLPEMRATHTPEQAQVLWEVLLWAVAEHRVGHRPDRYEPRAVKRHPKAYPRLTVSRAQARRYMRQQLKSTATKC